RRVGGRRRAGVRWLALHFVGLVVVGLDPPAGANRREKRRRLKRISSRALARAEARRRLNRARPESRALLPRRSFGWSCSLRLKNWGSAVCTSMAGCEKRFTRCRPRP